MDKYILVSILIPNYNKANYLKETLDSIIGQTYPFWECVIVDDHSTDNSWEILESYIKSDQRIKIFRRPENKKQGGNAARNFAFEISEGQFINWFDSDDIMEPDFLRKKVEELENDEKLDFVLSNFIEKSKNSKRILLGRKQNIYEEDVNFALKIITGDFWIPTPSPLFRKSFLLRLPVLFDEELIWDQETEFFSRILLMGPKFRLVQSSVFQYRTGIDSQTSNFKRLDESARSIISFSTHRKIFINFTINRDLRQEERKYFKWYFGFLMTSIPICSKEYWDLIIFSIQNGLVPNIFFLPKVLVFRFLKSLKIN